MAESVIAHVNAIHGRIEGHGPDGRPYRANDPALLMWVHVAEVHAFVQAHQWLAHTPLSPREVDTYVSEMALVAERLGVQDPPRDWARLTQVLAAHQADLRFDERAATVHHLLLNFPVKGWERPLMQALLAAAQDLLGLADSSTNTGSGLASAVPAPGHTIGRLGHSMGFGARGRERFCGPAHGLIIQHTGDTHVHHRHRWQLAQTRLAGRDRKTLARMEKPRP
jgi:hypothetical protein